MILVPWVLSPRACLAQGDGATTALLAGAGLGAFSGAGLGLIGGLSPCNRSVDGTRCARVLTLVGTTVGTASGAVLGYYDRPGALADRIEGAGVGAFVGAAVGLGLKVGIRQYAWADVGAAAALGATIGASPVGAGLGFGLGLTVGSVLWATVPGKGIPDVVAIGLAGLALGGLLDWVHGAAVAQAGSGPMMVPLQVRLRW